MNAVITGATKGIGRAIAEKFADRGYNLCVCSRHKDDLDTLKSVLENSSPGIRVHTRAVDLSKKNEVLDFSKFVLDVFDNKPDILINNAGLFIPGEICEEEDGTLEKMIETNLYSAYHLTRALVPYMKALELSYIINMASVASLLAYPNGGSYSISKFALRGFSMVLREELKESGIKVTTVLPGATWSASWEGVDLPESRLMQASDIATVVDSIMDLSPAAVMEEIILRPQLGDL